MNPAPSLLGHLTRGTVPVARSWWPTPPPSPPPPSILAFAQLHGDAKKRMKEWESGVSVEIKVSWAGTVPARTRMVAITIVKERAALAAKSVWTRETSAQKGERAGAATTRSLHLPCRRVLASLVVHVHLLLTHPIKILLVHAARRTLTPVKTTDAPNSGTGWVAVSMCPAQTGWTWTPTST